MSQPMYLDDKCFVNAYINKFKHYKDLNLKYVIGSLGLNGWFEYGGKDWTLRDFQKRNSGKIMECWDAHCWLEDAQGNVYDFVQPSWNGILKVRNRPLLGRETGIIEGVSKEELKKQGIEYVPADKETQLHIYLSLKIRLLSGDIDTLERCMQMLSYVF